MNYLCAASGCLVCSAIRDVESPIDSRLSQRSWRKDKGNFSSVSFSMRDPVLLLQTVWFSSLLMPSILTYKYYVRNVLFDKPTWQISSAYERPHSSSNVSFLFLISSSFSQHLANWDLFCGFGYWYYHVNLFIDQE